MGGGRGRGEEGRGGRGRDETRRDETRQIDRHDNGEDEDTQRGLTARPPCLNRTAN